MKLLKMIAGALIVFTSASAFADCRIVLSLCRPAGIHAATSFQDSHLPALHDPNRCLQRAREYLMYCGSNQQVGAEFYVNGVLTISSYVTLTTSQLWTKAPSGVWIQLKPNY